MNFHISGIEMTKISVQNSEWNCYLSLCRLKTGTSQSLHTGDCGGFDQKNQTNANTSYVFFGRYDWPSSRCQTVAESWGTNASTVSAYIVFLWLYTKRLLTFDACFLFICTDCSFMSCYAQFAHSVVSRVANINLQNVYSLTWACIQEIAFSNFAVFNNKH